MALQCLDLRRTVFLVALSGSEAWITYWRLAWFHSFNSGNPVETELEACVQLHTPEKNLGRKCKGTTVDVRFSKGGCFLHVVFPQQGCWGSLIAHRLVIISLDGVMSKSNQHIVKILVIQKWPSQIVAYYFKGIVQICWTFTQPQAIQDEFVSSSEQIWRNWPMDPLQWMGAVRMRVQTADKNITITHTNQANQ